MKSSLERLRLALASASAIRQVVREGASVDQMIDRFALGEKTFDDAFTRLLDVELRFLKPADGKKFHLEGDEVESWIRQGRLTRASTATAA